MVQQRRPLQLHDALANVRSVRYLLHAVVARSAIREINRKVARPEEYLAEPRFARLFFCSTPWLSAMLGLVNF